MHKDKGGGDNEGPDNEREGEKTGGDFEVPRHRDGRGGEREERGEEKTGGDNEGPRNRDERGGEKTAGEDKTGYRNREREGANREETWKDWDKGMSKR